MSARRLPVILALTAGSVLLRIVYFVQLADGPCPWMHRAPETDMSFFDRWARQIAGGDWLTRQSLHPHHQWHEVVAREHLRAHPELAARYGPVPEVPAFTPAARAVWEQWWGGPRFHQEPLYPYLVALTYRLCGADPRWVFVWQMALGVLANLLVYAIAWRHFGPSAAAVAGVLALLCGPLMFFEITLLRTSSAVAATLALVWLTDHALERSTAGRWALVGLGCGLMLLLELKFAVFALGALLLLALAQRRHPARCAAQAGAMLLAAGLPLIPVALRNRVVGVHPLALSSVGAASFAAANTVDAPPDAAFFVSYRHVPRILGQTGGRLLPTVVETLRTHPDAGSVLRLLAGKLATVWHWYEQPNNVNFYYYRLHAPVLRATCVGLAVLGPLGLAGLVLALLEGRRVWPLLLALLSSMVPLLLFTVLARYRAPLLAVLIPPAGLALARAPGLVRAGRWLQLAAALGIGGAGALLVLRPLPAGKSLLMPSDYGNPIIYFYTPMIEDALQRNDAPAVIRLAEDALRFLPPELVRLDGSRPAETGPEAGFARAYLPIYEAYASALRAVGRHPQAERSEQRAAELRWAFENRRRAAAP